MALVWIKKISNNATKRLVLSQNDPTYHPVLHSGNNIQLPDTPDAPNGNFANQDIQIKQNQRIVMLPKSSLTADFFVIPWVGHGSLYIISPDSKFQHSVDMQVGKGKYPSGDVILANIPVYCEIPCGNNGVFRNVEIEIQITEKDFAVIILNLNDIDELSPNIKEVEAYIRQFGKAVINWLFY